MKNNNFIIGLTLFFITTAHGYFCDRSPKNVNDPKPNNKYLIEMAENPSEYSPGKEYKIYLKSKPSSPFTNYFTRFMLVVEAAGSLDTLQNVKTGLLEAVDTSVARFTTQCPNAIVQMNDMAKSNVAIKWTAPPSGNGCVAIKATVFENSDNWYADDGGLTKILCEEEENKDEQSPALEECCACNEAKYEVAFQGMWTRNTHPNEYPLDMWSTKLGELIGASHKHNTSFWRYDSPASEGLKLLAEKGDTELLENELKEGVKNDNVRTIIKARELPYPYLTGTSYTVFRVDQNHHLISVVSKITPSPDWIVGVADMELCTSECEWIESRTLNLYPWDVGTDDGTSYLSADSPSSSEQTVHRITSKTENTPFYSQNEELKPIAQIRVTRQKVYEKNCENDACEVTDWSEWSSCSSTCNGETRTRDRQLLKPENKDKCAENNRLQELQENERCAPNENCDALECTNGTWSEWTPCNVTCGPGNKVRHILPIENSEENKENEERVSCEETVECYNPSCEETTTVSDDFNGLTSGSQVISEGQVVDCRVSKWSDWGECSTCGKKGFQYKERRILVHPKNGGQSCPKRLQKSKHCYISCDTPCRMGKWSSWSPCSATCGPHATQQRTRPIVDIGSKGGSDCESRIEERACPLPDICIPGYSRY